VSYIQYKTIKNKTYAYEMTSYWDKEKKQSRSVSKYLGSVDPKTKEITKFAKKVSEKEKLIVDFGDGYFLSEFIKNAEIFPILTSIFKQVPGLFPLIIFRLCMQSPMYNCESWFEGNITKYLFKDVNISSQRISDILSFVGQESIQRDFFIQYNNLIGGSDRAVIIDATSLPNQINIDFNSWGRSDGKIEKQFKLLCVVDQIKKTPLFYRFLPGSLTDVSTLQTTILELESMGVKHSFTLLDAGYFSESNMCDLYKRNIDFLIRMPAGRKIYKDIILKKIAGIEDLSNAKILGERSFFIKKLKIDLYGNIAYAYVVLDPERKSKETKKLLNKYCNEKSDRDEEKYKLAYSSCGIMMLISSKDIPSNEVVSSYYLRQSVEQIFGFSKDDLGLLPIRNHNDLTVRGYLFLQFILLILYIQIREKLFGISTVEQAIINLKKLKCKVFEGRIIPAELSKTQRLIFEQNKIIVPKFLGI
jgi:transposase